MKALRFLNVAILSTLVATSVALYAQDEKREEPKEPRQEQPRPEGNRPEEKQDQTQVPRENQAKPEKMDKQEKKEQKQEEKQQQHEMKPDRNQAAAHQEEHGRPAGKSARIPDDKFRSHFGRSHTVRVQRPVIVQGQPGFIYGGYSFVFVDPWPVEWAYGDDCYVDYIDGEYFLFNLLHPGVRISLFVVM
jgi:hypothetical protein